ncbi:MAG: TAXI family TRAP transporter solute-binding subunit [Burkholderiales bacterium]|nr:TAXI family TRAP transporter solute-binding subunit [Pseudomonadota bacterium]MCC7067991.1 TAXI family TRAP transporter solute-binding subunit [Burkholderiales bacterium]MCZ2135223.1 TAXI family TRAP transporter solute-binding subunit [Burkholderiales bacterium]
MKRSLITTLIAAAGIALVGVGSASAQTFFRINTGGTAGTYYPIGGLIANAISQPTVPGLVATAVASNGSVANINAIQSGSAEAGFSQADVAYWAYTGTGTFEGKPKVTDVRLIANLYPESFHLVARKAANIKSIADLKGKRVSLDEPGSGTLVNARAILAAYGISEKDIKPEFLKPNAAGEKLKDNSLDAFFFVGGYPAGAIAELAATGGIDLLSISGPEADKLVKQYGFYSVDTIPADTYKGVGVVKTLAVGAQLVTSAKQDATLIYNITKALWNDNTRKALDSGHAKGKAIVRANAVAGAGIPLHPGAEKYYKEVGLIK